MTKVVFETAAFADAIKNANTVAPSKGKSFDEAGGIVVDIVSNGDGTGVAVIRSTNNLVWYREWVTPVSVEGPSTSWRLFSSVFAPMVASLPIGSGKAVTLEEQASGYSKLLLVTSGRVKAKMNLMDQTYYPEWEVFDPDLLTPVSDLGGRIKLVEWAADFKNPSEILSGIHFDGVSVRATDRYRIAVVPLEVTSLQAAERTLTVPAGMLGSLLKQTGEVRMGFTDHQMLLMPNDYVQIRAVILAGEYPNTGRFATLDYSNSVTFNKTSLIDCVNRAALASPSERMPTLKLFIGKEEIAAKVDTEATTILDTIEVPGQATHPRVEIPLTPKMFVDALQNAPGDSVTLHYNPENTQSVLRLNGSADYVVWMVARRPGAEAD